MVSIDCAACRISNPVNGIVPAVRCYHCGTETALGADFWSDTITLGWFAMAIGREPGEPMTDKSNDPPVRRASFGRAAPRCQECEGPDLDVERLATFVESGRCFCPGCGAAIRLRAADALGLHINPRTRFLVNETAHDAAAMAIQARRTPVLFACMGCGGALEVDGASRQVTCRYCDAANYLPDGLWLQLRPVPTPEPFFMICEYDEASWNEARWCRDDVRAADAALPGLPFDWYARLAVDREEYVRASLARNPVVPPQLLSSLAGDRSDRVRRALASNPATDPQVLTYLLAEDDDHDVMWALINNPSLPPGSGELLAKSRDSRKRAAAATHLALSMKSLKRLARDNDDHVKAAARTRLETLRAQGHK